MTKVVFKLNTQAQTPISNIAYVFAPFLFGYFALCE